MHRDFISFKFPFVPLCFTYNEVSIIWDFDIELYVSWLGCCNEAVSGKECNAHIAFSDTSDQEKILYKLHFTKMVTDINSWLQLCCEVPLCEFHRKFWAWNHNWFENHHMVTRWPVLSRVKTSKLQHKRLPSDSPLKYTPSIPYNFIYS